MKKIKNILFKSTALLLVLTILTTLAACGKKGNEDIKISINVDKQEMLADEVATLDVSVIGGKDTSYTLIYPETLITITDNKVVVKNQVLVDTDVTIMAVANGDKSKSASVTIKIKAPSSVKITLTSDKEVIKEKEVATLTTVVENAMDKTYTYMVSDQTVVKVENNVVSIINEPTIDKLITITAISNQDKTATASVNIVVKAKYVEGKVGELTSQMLSELGNSSITVNGKLVDIYQDFKQSFNSSTHEYGIRVEMSEDAWLGSWWAKGYEDNVITDIYRKGLDNGLKDQYGRVGYGLDKVFINKDNVAERKLVKDYISVPSLWETQHLWNHLGQLQINKFEYDVVNNVYVYNADMTNEDDLFLMTYFSFSLTPMLSDTLDKLYLVVEDGKITKLLAQTEILNYGENTEEDPDAMSYTTVELTFSNVGTTVVADPTPYEMPENGEALQAALAKIAASRNYTFHAKDTMTVSPDFDSGEYSLESTKTNGTRAKVRTNTSATGTTGCYGKVTTDAILLATTSMYSATMDDKPYLTKYTGFKKIDENTYDEFEYQTKPDCLVGIKKYNGDIFDQMPAFEFAANIFNFEGSQTKNGKTIYVFKLRESAIMRDIAMQVSCYSYADDAESSVDNGFTIKVDNNGNVVETSYPYSLVGGVYSGYVTTTYGNFDTTTLDEDLFDGYVPRVLKTSWSEYMMKYYTSTHSTRDSHDEVASVVINQIFGESASDVPSPDVIMNIVGDNINGPFFDYDEKYVDVDGNVVYKDYFTITTTSLEFDENSQMTNYEEFMYEFQQALTNEGFVLSVANTDTTGGESGRSTRYVCFIKGNVQIVIENNHTKYLWIHFYVTGDWKLSR